MMARAHAWTMKHDILINTNGSEIHSVSYLICPVNILYIYLCNSIASHIVHDHHLGAHKAGYLLDPWQIKRTDRYPSRTWTSPGCCRFRQL